MGSGFKVIKTVSADFMQLQWDQLFRYHVKLSSLEKEDNALKETINAHRISSIMAGPPKI